MKLLFVLSEYLPDSGGGIITYYREVLPRLVEAGHRVDVLVARPDRLDLPEHEIGGVRIRYLPGNLVKKFLPGFERFKTELPTFHAFLPVAWAAYAACGAGEGYDLVETTDWQLLFSPWVCQHSGPPVVLACHGSCGQVDWHERRAPRSLDGDIVRLAESRAVRAASAVHTGSRLNAAFWEGRSGRPVSVLLPILRLAEPAPLQAKTSSSIQGLVVGRLQNWKGPHILCEALQAVPEVRIHWIGRDMPHNGEMELTSAWLRRDYPEEFGKRLLPVGAMSHPEVLEQIRSASFLCVPSIWDVFNLTAVEAMQAGKPVICSRAAGAEMLIRHGGNGFLFDPQAPAELAECLREVWNMDGPSRARLGNQAWETIRREFDSQFLLEQRSSYYRQVIASPSSKTSEDEWLADFLTPLLSAGKRTQVLDSFSCKELSLAAAASCWRGLRRRLGSESKKLAKIP